MLSHLLLRLKSLLHDGMLLAIALIIALIGFIPYTFSLEGRSYNYSIARYNDALTNLANAEGAGAFSSAPASLLENLEAEKRALLDIKIAHSYGDQEAEFLARLAYERVSYDTALAGYSTQNLLSAECIVVFYSQLVEQQQYYILDNPREMPAAYYLASQMFSLSPALLFLPACVAFSAAFSSVRGTRSRSFERVLPVSKVTLLVADFLAGLIMAFGTLLVSLLPAVLYQGIRNGIGDLSYPVVDIINNQIAVTTVGGYLGSLLILLALAFCFLGTLALLLSRFIDNRTALLLVSALCVFLPNIPQYFQIVTDLKITQYLPITYLSVTPIIGVVRQYENFVQLDGATFFMGIFVLASTTVIMLALTIVAEKVIPLLAPFFGVGHVIGARGHSR